MNTEQGTATMGADPHQNKENVGVSDERQQASNAPVENGETGENLEEEEKPVKPTESGEIGQNKEDEQP